MLDVSLIRSELLAWYDRHARSLAWRAPPGVEARTDPYRVWLSEVMLQQTTTPHATPYFQSFTARWPTVSDLAGAEDGEVMAAWAGLGYYARARNVVDGNVERVMARLFAVETPVPAAGPELRRLAGLFVTDERPGDWAQALMDLGATVCRPNSPLCGQCPAADQCLGLASGAPERFPVKLKKAERPHRRGVAFVMIYPDGQVALERRPGKGVLGGGAGVPTSDWSAAPDPTPPVAADWREAGAVEHVFTHFSLTLTVRVAHVRPAGDQ